MSNKLEKLEQVFCEACEGTLPNINIHYYNMLGKALENG